MQVQEESKHRYVDEEFKVEQPRSKPGPINPSPKNFNPKAPGKQSGGVEQEISNKKKLFRQDAINAIVIEVTEEEKVPAMQHRDESTNEDSFKKPA